MSKQKGTPAGKRLASPEDHKGLITASPLGHALESTATTETNAEVVVVDAMEADQHAPALPYLVVAFGASAGGLKALRDVLAPLSATTGMAFVLITHLSPDHKSYMTEILSKETAMSVVPMEEGQTPEPDHLYILTPNVDATIQNGRFRLHPRPGSPAHHLPIDLFFRSLAADQKNHAIGVVLSGADSDGALGLKTIKGEGGIALVQSPESAQHSSMPRNSIAADHVDLVLRPAEIAAELQRLAAQFRRPAIRELDESGPAGSAGSTGISDETGGNFTRILQMLRGVSGLEFRLYKEQTVRRRIARRMVLLHIDSLSEYLRYLQSRPEELRTLQEEALINVTRFFRDPEFWESLAATVLPAFFLGRSSEKPVRIWSAGCATGEEAFSLAMTLLEYLSANNLDTPVQIFGTDASDRAIDFARIAIYPDTIAAEISPDRLRRFFVKVDRGYQIGKRVRDTCIFARQNLSGDPPFSHIDLLSCRNVMIYFQQILQRRVIATFHYALEPGGYLLLGMSESLREFPEIFSTFDRKTKIYVKGGGGTPSLSDTPDVFSSLRPASLQPKDLAPARNWPDLDLQQAADRIVLARFTPAGVVIDDELNILQVRGQTAPFVELPPGAVSWNLLRLLRTEVASQIKERLERAVRENVPVSISPVTLHDSSGPRQIQVDVLPISSAFARAHCFLILFQTLLDAPSVSVVELLPPEPQASGATDVLSSRLRSDLDTTRLHLQALVDERDVHTQELVTANEEIQSANEELQSSNEELETTKGRAAVLERGAPDGE